MSLRPELRLDWATHEAAAFACRRWHYSRTMPVGKIVCVGVWEDAAFSGVVLFAWGANKSLGTPYALSMFEVAELVRVALREHATPVSRIVAIAVRMLRTQSPGLRLIVSFADPIEGHHGGIYQAAGWVYSGTSAPSFELRLGGRRINKRAYTGSQFGGGIASVAEVPSMAARIRTPGKHRYLMPLDAEMRARILPLAKPYPKRAK